MDTRDTNNSPVRPQPVTHPPSQNVTDGWVQVEPRPTWADRGITGTAAVITLSVGGFMVGSVSIAPTMGATRSARLRWEARQCEIEEAIQTQQDYLRECGIDDRADTGNAIDTGNTDGNTSPDAVE